MAGTAFRLEKVTESITRVHFGNSSIVYLKPIGFKTGEEISRAHDPTGNRIWPCEYELLQYLHQLFIRQPRTTCRRAIELGAGFSELSGFFYQNRIIFRLILRMEIKKQVII